MDGTSVRALAKMQELPTSKAGNINSVRVICEEGNVRKKPLSPNYAPPASGHCGDEVSVETIN